MTRRTLDPQSAPIRLDFRRLRTRRRLLDISQGALAKEIGRHRNAVSAWERGKAVPDAEDLAYLARTLGTPMWDLFVVLDAEDEPVTARWARK
ncbi:MAG: helix-turn-helix domain-containing protein [Vicinamibacterales bacterium]|jgi:transcriptional regulator with XRE-family HTH domain|nr:helix-turn-helix domain-containing protein [Vicinamibacterales bacterium]MCU0477177.1 helix-turn-helix domain-containing protein [Chloroflexota bacterium]MCU0562324.1 helix-turn-helix domain-containing protein [Desulfobacterales bacterium]